MPTDSALERSPRRTRRRFLEATALGAAGLAGCLGGGESATTTRPSVDPPPTLIATWRGGDPARQTTLQWVAETDEASEPVSVTLSASGDEGATVETELEKFGLRKSYLDMTRHRAAFDDLEPDTEYRIVVDGADTETVVRTAPDTISEPLTFAQGGDMGTSPYVGQLHDQAASWDPLFALVGGDIAYADGTSLDKWLTFLETWHSRMQSGNRLIPIATAIGNHEVQGHMDGSTDDAPFFYTLFDNREREHAYFALDIGDSFSALLLDSNHTTPVPGEQTDWLETALAEREDREHVFPVYHVPAYPSSKPISGAGRKRMEVREHWVPLFEEYDVPVAFEHDDHTYSRTHLLEDGEQSEDGVLYVGDGAWGRGPREAKSPEERPYLDVSESVLHVIRVELTADGTRKFRAVDTEGNTVDSFEHPY